MPHDQPVASTNTNGDCFRLVPSYRIHLWMGLGYPLILLGAMIWAASSRYLKLKDWAPLAMAGLAVWAIYELTKAIRWGNFQVVLTNQSISVGARTLAWSEIARAAYRPAFGRSPAVTLVGKDGTIVEIPGATDGLGFIKASIEKNVADVEKS